MSGSGVPPHEMSGSIGPDEGFERLLRGETPGTPEEAQLGAVVEDVRAAFPAQPLLAEEAHLAGIVETAQLLADKGDPATRPASKAVGRGGHVSGLPKRRRIVVRVPEFRSLAAKIVAGLVVLMSMFGGLAVAGALPGGVQDAVANAADGIGVNLPGGDDDEASVTGDQGDQNDQGDDNGGD